MLPADSLNPEGLAALRRAREAVSTADDPDSLADIVDAYAFTVHVAATARAAWQAAGEPLVAEHPNGATGEHPLARAVRESAREVRRAAQPLGMEVPRRKRKPPVVAAVRARQPGEPPRIRYAHEPPRVPDSQAL